MINKVETLAQIRIDLQGAKSMASLARRYGVNYGLVWRAMRGDGYVSPQLSKAVGTWQTRVRFAADVSPELRAELRAEAFRLGMTNGELLDLLWNTWITPIVWEDEVTE